MKRKDDLNFWKMKDDINFFENGAQYSCEWKTTSKIKNKQCNLKQRTNQP